jgi:regulator of ribonuclease activity A
VTPAFTTPDLCDAHAGRVEVAEPLFRSYGGRGAFAGRIVTVACFEDNSKVKELAAQPGDGQVIVVDGGGSMRCALLGDQIAAAAAANGWAGLLINGCVRDVDALGRLALGVQALGTHPRKTDKRGLGDIDVPVRFAGLRFVPGHWLYADLNGVIVADADLLSA